MMLNPTAKMDTHVVAIEHGNTHTSEASGAAPGRWTDKERLAIATAVERMDVLGINSQARVYVDDENRLPSYARHIGTAWGGQPLDDEELNHAIGWLPEEAFLNDDSPWPGSYNPYITVAHLRTIMGA
ncbi:hypothetical protein [Mycolicibacterium fortuitum]|uniref:Uncharacterized protein n=2 Tax=Mycolicibacterium fortuitum TaxID=1766 RepID=A0AAE5AGQ0_MYCFO|nr:hypothetical protein [Mycolicibacterium fortuitum]MCV7137570.1 hypothetical protein [Mycolicibacterium fortuitum]MDV7195656.1 hypothetical protein [Mycolicibacterium fortuitum]MDV7209331.1 hypothetical protein [Mycolicibacterium fortuitum]MDV7231169.1 hypothetical protein [Mycolicibacterium fortuitum]MDV7262746.1 hypothetical protein [Mycolicibacterium fortuitum]